MTVRAYSKLSIGVLALVCLALAQIDNFEFPAESTCTANPSLTCLSGIGCCNSPSVGNVSFCLDTPFLRTGEKCCCNYDNLTGCDRAPVWSCLNSETCGPLPLQCSGSLPPIDSKTISQPVSGKCVYPSFSTCSSSQFCCDSSYYNKSWCATNYSSTPPTLRCCCDPTSADCSTRWVCDMGDYCGATYATCTKPPPIMQSNFPMTPLPLTRQCKYATATCTGSTDICCDIDFESYSECKPSATLNGSCCCDMYYGCQYDTWVCTDPKKVCGKDYSEWCIDPPKLPLSPAPSPPVGGYPITNFSVTVPDAIGYCRYKNTTCSSSYDWPICCDSHRESFSECFEGTDEPQVCCCDSTRGCIYDMWSCNAYDRVCGPTYSTGCLTKAKPAASGKSRQFSPSPWNTSSTCRYSNGGCSSYISTYACCEDSVSNTSFCVDGRYNSSTLKLMVSESDICCCDSSLGCGYYKWSCSNGYICGGNLNDCIYDDSTSGTLKPPSKKILPMWTLGIAAAVILASLVAIIVMYCKFKPEPSRHGPTDPFFKSLLNASK